MKPEIRILYTLNILVELIAPIIAFGYLLVPYWEGSQADLYWWIFVLSLIAYPLYVWAVIRVNQRRFPRTTYRAIMATVVPVMVGLAYIAMILPFVSAIPAFGPSESAVLLDVRVAALLLTSALYFSVFIESVQQERVRAFSFHVVVWAVLSIYLLFAATFFFVLGFNTWINNYAFDLSAAPGFFVIELVAWMSGFLAVLFLKYHRAGRKLYAKKGYRPNAAIIVTDGDGNVLLCERSDRPGTIQTVQGGIDPGETPEHAASREMKEELGLFPDQFELRAMLLTTKSYEWEPAVKRRLKRTGYQGQEQYFFLAEISPDATFDLDYYHREFRKVWWGTPEQLLKLSWSKKRPGIEAALKGFNLL